MGSNRHRTLPVQPDLFAARGALAPSVPETRSAEPVMDASALDDATLVARLPLAGLSEAPVLATEAARRKLPAAIPALDALCRRFKGFGLHHTIPEQTAALTALAAIGGRSAADTVRRVIEDLAIQGPGLVLAWTVAARLGARLAPTTLSAALRDPTPEIREAACDCVRGHASTASILIDLLDDLNRSVALAAARALGRLGRTEARPLLLVALAAAPTQAIIAALAPIADETVIVRFGQTARTHPELVACVLDALDDLDDARAGKVAAAVRASSR